MREKRGSGVVRLSSEVEAVAIVAEANARLIELVESDEGKSSVSAAIQQAVALILSTAVDVALRPSAGGRLNR